MTASPPDTPPAATPRRGRLSRRATQSRLRRRLGSTARMIAALALVGTVYAAFTPSAPASGEPAPSSDAAAGKALFETSCITCHGANGQGVNGRGPSLLGVGSAAVEFQVNTGRMPAVRPEAQAEQKQPVFDEKQAQQLGAYVESLGGGPQTAGGQRLPQWREHRPGRRPVPRQLLVLPRVRRRRRRAVVGQVRADAGQRQ